MAKIHCRLIIPHENGISTAYISDETNGVIGSLPKFQSLILPGKLRIAKKTLKEKLSARATKPGCFFPFLVFDDSFQMVATTCNQTINRG